MIMATAGRVSVPDSITILGAGSAYNIPLEELARRFHRICLVDIDRDSLQAALSGLAPELRGKVELHLADATGGLATTLLAKGLELISSSEDPAAARAGLIDLFKADTAHAAFDAPALQTWKASCVVSSGLSSQSTIFPIRALMEAYRTRFEMELGEDFFVSSGAFRLRDEWVRRHGELLASLVHENGRVYWADTVAETPCLAELGERPLNAIIDRVVRFLETTYLKTFLFDSGKQILAERFAEGLPFSLAKDAEGRRQQGEQLLRSFNDKLDVPMKRRLAWAVMTLAGENLISPNHELALLGLIIRESERISPHAIRPILGGRLSAFCPPGLVPDGQLVQWLWINDPEATVTLNGSSYYVDACILKPGQESAV